jgi:tetraacyldisaccharide 4'-kinase
VAVDANRKAGIRRMQQEVPQLGLVILDDAFQHRRVKPAL